MPPSSRKQSIDLMRCLAAFGIVWAHMQAPYMIEGYVALALFLILTAFLSVRSLARGGERRFWLGRGLRFLLPWVVWSGVFLALDLARGTPWPEVLRVEDPLSLLVGPMIHLWFLPFVVLTSPLVVATVRGIGSPAALWAACAVALAASLGATWLHDTAALPAPFAQWVFALPPFLYGLLSAAGRHQRVVVAPLVFILLAGGVPTLVWGSIMAPFLIAAALFFEAFWRARIDLPWPDLAALGALAFGIYLLHPVWVLIWYRIDPGLPVQVGVLAVFTASAITTALIRTTAAGRLLA